MNLYDLHDGKMLYCLTQHSLWNRKYHPFLLCKCKRGEGVKDSNHQCQMLTDGEHLHWYDRSEQRWCQKIKQVGEAKYTREDHLKWCDEKNIGVTHFGIHPLEMKRSNIRNDVFHMKCAVTRNLMTELRAFMLNQSIALIDKFKSDVLTKFWNNFHIFVWNSGKKFASFQGNKLAVFLANVPQIVQFLNSNLINTDYLSKLKRALVVWTKMFEFLGITIIKEGKENEYKEKINSYKENAKVLYALVKNTFLSNGLDIGSK